MAYATLESSAGLVSFSGLSMQRSPGCCMIEAWVGGVRRPSPELPPSATTWDRLGSTESFRVFQQGNHCLPAAFSLVISAAVLLRLILCPPPEVPAAVATMAPLGWLPAAAWLWFVSHMYAWFAHAPCAWTRCRMSVVINMHTLCQGYEQCGSVDLSNPSSR